MNAVTDLKSHARQMAAVREAINERARSLNCDDKARRHAVHVGILAVSTGVSGAAAVQLGYAALPKRTQRLVFTLPNGAPQS
jgi:hypothetical protein